MRLNVGCGKRHLEGYINIDFESNWSKKKPDVACDIRKLPYEDESCDEVCAIHVFEHFYIWEAEEILKEWARVLKPGGRLVLEVPCLNKVLAHFSQDKIRMEYTFWALYGDPSYKDPHMVHKWCYPKEQLTAMMQRVCRQVSEERPQFHKADRDMRLVGIK